MNLYCLLSSLEWQTFWTAIGAVAALIAIFSLENSVLTILGILVAILSIVPMILMGVVISLVQSKGRAYCCANLYQTEEFEPTIFMQIMIIIGKIFEGCNP